VATRSPTGRQGQQWALDLPDRVLLVAAYRRTNPTMRQIGPLFGVSHSAAHRVIHTLSPLALALTRRRPTDQATIVDGTLISTRDHRLAAPSKNYRYPTNHQLAIDANTRLVVVAGVETASGRAGAHMRIHLPRVARETAADRARSSHAMTVTIRERQLITAVHARAE
jgi:hypothetical protein